MTAKTKQKNILPSNKKSILKQVSSNSSLSNFKDFDIDIHSKALTRQLMAIGEKEFLSVLMLYVALEDERWGCCSF